MHRIDGANHASNLFTEGPPGTQVTDDWLNDVQENLVDTITSSPASISLVKGTYTQLASAISARIAAARTAWLAVTHAWTASHSIIVSGGSNALSLSANTTNALLAANNSTTNAAIKAQNINTGPALEVADGNAKFTGTAPVKTDSIKDTVSTANIVKAWGRVTTTAPGAIALDDGFNITSVAFSGNGVLVTFGTDFADAKYAITVTHELNLTPKLNSKAAGSVVIEFQDYADANIPQNLFSGSFSFTCVGRQ